MTLARCAIASSVPTFRQLRSEVPYRPDGSERPGHQSYHAKRGVILPRSSFILGIHRLASYTTRPPTMVITGLMSLMSSSGTVR